MKRNSGSAQDGKKPRLALPELRGELRTVDTSADFIDVRGSKHGLGR